MTPPTDNRPAVDTRRLTFSQIRDAVDLTYQELAVPEWGGALLLRSATIADLEHIAHQATVTVSGNKTEQRVELYNRALLRFCVIDPALTKEEVDELFTSKRALVMSRILDAIKALNRLDEGAATQAENAFPDGPVPGAVVSPSTALGVSEHRSVEGGDASGSLDRVESVQ